MPGKTCTLQNRSIPEFLEFQENKQLLKDDMGKKQCSSDLPFFQKLRNEVPFL